MIRFVLFCVFIFNCIASNAQTHFYNPSSIANFYIKQIELDKGYVLDGIHTGILPLSSNALSSYYNEDEREYVKNYLLFDNQDVRLEKGNSKKPIFKKLYTNPADFLIVRYDGITIRFNPILYWSFQAANNNKKHNFTSMTFPFTNGRGADIRGVIGKSIGFSTTLIEYQSRLDTMQNGYFKRYNAIPNFSRFTSFKNNGVDYREARANINYSTSNFNFTLGYDQNFVGEGYRSLLLSNNAPSYTFFRINSHFKKLQYTNLYAKLVSKHTPLYDQLLPSKYFVAHYLSWNISQKVNITAFESTVFSRKRGFEWSYLNPIIFFRAIEHDLGSPDNVLLGLQSKIIPFKNVKIYSQLVIDDLRFFDVVKSTGWWGNKIGAQLGIVYNKAFGLKNLYMQSEVNAVRPFTYSHVDTVSNFSHYNQPLTHPLGANFFENVFFTNYRFHKQAWIEIQNIYSVRGMPTDSFNVGDNPMQNSYTTNYATFKNELGNKFLQGNKRVENISKLTLTYTPFHNYYFDLYAQNQTSTKQWWIGLAFRVNAFDNKIVY